MVVDNCSMELIEQKVFSGERLSFEEGLYLDASADILQLAKLANHVREIKNGRYAYYNVNTHLNPTNICVYRCNFCAFRADLKSERGALQTQVSGLIQKVAKANSDQVQLQKLIQAL